MGKEYTVIICTKQTKSKYLEYDKHTEVTLLKEQLQVYINSVPHLALP